jgi:hypothetical protein
MSNTEPPQNPLVRPHTFDCPFALGIPQIGAYVLPLALVLNPGVSPFGHSDQLRQIDQLGPRFR